MTFLKHIGMLPRQSEKPKPQISQAEAARKLGVSKYHLNRVIRGHRKSHSLTARYQALQREAI